MIDSDVCVRCGAPVTAGSEAAFCGACGAPLAAGALDAQPLVCPFCGGPIVAGQQFCMTCGTRLDANGPRPLARLEDNVLVPAPEQQEIVIGRDPDLQQSGQCYLEHPAVSLHHARLERHAAQWYLIDLNSAKGTFVNYQRVPPGPPGWPVTEHDVIWVAPFAFRLATNGSRSTLQPAHMRLQTQGLRRTVKVGARTQTILDMRQTPLVFVPGEFIALVGGSGSGKSTFMKALNGLAPAQQGQILIDGHPIIDGENAQPFSALNAIVGYVPQDDIMYRDLTVRELLRSVARLRLADLSNVEINGDIDEALEAVGLQAHAHQLIGHLSGGQRKRVNIAMELLARPRLLFLDEPTSGLDPGLDLELMKLLRSWARGESLSGPNRDPKTIVLVTHATENIELCDFIAFMEPGGRLAYFGPPKEAKFFFFPESEPEEVTYSQMYRRVAEGPQRDGEETPTTWADLFLQSPLYEKYVVERSRQAQVAAADSLPAAQQTSLPLTTRLRSGLRQTLILSRRLGVRVLRDRFNALFMLLQPPFVAWLLSGVSARNALLPGRSAGDAQKVLFILACAVVWLGIINASKAIVSEQDVYQRERRYGVGPLPYVLSKIIVLGCIGVIQVLLLSLSLQVALDLPKDGLITSIPAEYGVTLTLSLLAGLALGLLVSAVASTSDLAATLMFVALIIQVIFSGLLFTPKGVAEVPAALTISRWSLRALGSSTDLNLLLSKAIPLYKASADYKHESGYLLLMWLVLLVYAGVCIGLAAWRQSRK